MIDLNYWRMRNVKRYRFNDNVNSISNFTGANIQRDIWLCSKWCIVIVSNIIINNQLYNNSDS